MPENPEPTKPAQGQTSGDDVAMTRFDGLTTLPKRAALISGILAVAGTLVNVGLAPDFSGGLLTVTVIAALVCLLSLWNIANVSRAALARMEATAPQVEGKFALWKAGTGGYDGVPFLHNVERERLGVLTYLVHGLQVEIGILASQVSSGYGPPTGRRHPYVAVRLPEPLPHMLLSSRHLSRVLGVPVMPDQWDRSQLVDVGFGRRSRLYVGDGGEPLARRFFSPEMVRLFQQAGRTYDIETKGRQLYLYSTRSVAASERRWNAQRALIDGLAAAVADSEIWELVRRQSRGRGPAYTDLRVNFRRTATIFFSAVGAIIVVVSLIVLHALGMIE